MIRLLLLVLATSCATTFRSSVAFTTDSAVPITEDDVRLAWDARPALPSSFHLAFLCLSANRCEGLGPVLEGLPGAAGVVPVPRALLDGDRRFAEAPRGQTPALDLRRLRVLAAQAHAELLVVVDHTHRVRQRSNALAATGVLLVPLLAVPFLSTTTESAVDAYVFDTRSGALLAHVGTSREERSPPHTVYVDPSEEALERQWSAMVAEAGSALSGLLAQVRAGGEVRVGRSP